jgi:TetR/AcrR family transcriptional regulator, transcriptional repressor of bet genes
MSARRPYHRETEARRREDLIAAALDLVATGGMQAATVRAIAERAGVTPGLIRHYFSSKEELTRAAYLHLMDKMQSDSMAGLHNGSDDPLQRFANFIAATVRPPVVDATAVGLWAGFLQLTRRDMAMRDVHRQTYLAFRDELQSQIACLPRAATPAQLHYEAIACNAVLDGLWLEGSLLPEDFDAGELVTIALDSIGAILGLKLPKAFDAAAYEPERKMP